MGTMPSLREIKTRMQCNTDTGQKHQTRIETLLPKVAGARKHDKGPWRAHTASQGPFVMLWTVVDLNH
jgi:hypothetical protein